MTNNFNLSYITSLPKILPDTASHETPDERVKAVSCWTTRQWENKLGFPFQGLFTSDSSGLEKMLFQKWKCIRA